MILVYVAALLCRLGREVCKHQGHCVSESNSHLQCVPAQRQGTFVAGKLISRRSAPTWVFG